LGREDVKAQNANNNVRVATMFTGYDAITVSDASLLRDQLCPLGFNSLSWSPLSYCISSCITALAGDLADIRSVVHN
jgi:hypothetical protein